MFLAVDPAASTSFSATYAYARANPLTYIDINGLWSTRDTLGAIQGAASVISMAAWAIAGVAAMTGIGAPVAGIAAGIGLTTGVLSAGASALLAYDSCTNTGKGSCNEAVAGAMLETAAIVPILKPLKGAASAAKAASGAAKSERFVPNPWGKRGSPNHVARVNDAESRLQANGWEIFAGGSLPERKFGSRYPDLVMRRGDEQIAVQVGRATKSGLPVARERRALDDLRSTGEFDHVFFLGYKP